MRHGGAVINATVSLFFFDCYRNLVSDAQMASVGLAPRKATKRDANLYQLRIWPTVKRKKGQAANMAGNILRFMVVT